MIANQSFAEEKRKICSIVQCRVKAQFSMSRKTCDETSIKKLMSKSTVHCARFEILASCFNHSFNVIASLTASLYKYSLRQINLECYAYIQCKKSSLKELCHQRDKVPFSREAETFGIKNVLALILQMKLGKAG